MNIKSLILGSATVALAATGAQAADAIVIAEPEPVEYVRVCDVYGAGFFYIPGTETCLRIGGEVRAQYGTGDSDIGNYNGMANDQWHSRARGRIYFDARSETEYGLLRGYVRLDLQKTNTEFSGAQLVNHVWLSLGGFRAGWTDSAWVSTPQGGVAAGGSHTDNGFFYGYHQTHLIQYNFSGSNGFFATGSIEFDETQNVSNLSNNYTPNLVGVVGVNQGWGAAWLKVGYDSDINTTGRDALDSGFGVSAGLHYNIPGAPGSSFRLIGYYADSDNTYNPLTGTGLAAWNTGLGVLAGGPEWSVLASYHHQFNAQFGASIGVQWFNDFYQAGTDISTGLDGWALELAAVWTPVQNFTVRTEVIYSDFDTVPGSVLDGDSISGFVRFSRFF
jgi:hypothetical protein